MRRRPSVGHDGHVARFNDLNDLLKVTASGVRGVTSSGILRPANPAVAVRMTRQLRTWGTGPALGFALGESRRPEELAVIDVDDPLHPEVTFVDIEHRCNALAQGLVDRGVRPGSTLGLLARNSRAYTEVIVAASRIGANLLYFDTNSTAEQVAAAVREYGVDMMVRNSAFASRCPTNVPWLGTDDPAGVSLLDAMPVRETITPDGSGLHLLAVPGGLQESADVGLRFDTFARILDALPVKLGATHLVAAPMFAPWGWLHHRLATTLGATEVLIREPEPERVLALVAAHDVEVLAATPELVASLTALPEQVRRRYDTSSLTCIAVGGALPPSVTVGALDAFGDVIYTAWGTAFEAVVSVASPQQLRANPATVGSVLPGLRVSVRDATGADVPVGSPGEVFVAGRAGADDGWVTAGVSGSIAADGSLTITG